MTDTNLMTRNEAAEFLGVSLPTLDRYARANLITRYRVGRRGVRFDRGELASFKEPKPVS